MCTICRLGFRTFSDGFEDSRWNAFKASSDFPVCSQPDLPDDHDFLAIIPMFSVRVFRSQRVKESFQGEVEVMVRGSGYKSTLLSSLVDENFINVK